MLVPTAVPLATTTGPAAPAVVSADVGWLVKPVQVPFAVAMLRVASFAALVFAVRTMSAFEPETVKNALTSGSADSAVRILPAPADASSPATTATLSVLGLLFIPAAVTVTVALPVPGATPAVVLALVGAAVSPAQVPLSIAIFRVPSFAAFVFFVRTTSAPLPETVKKPVVLSPISASAASAVRILPATAEASSPMRTATATVFGVPFMPAAVTVTETSPLVVIVPTTVAVSTWFVPGVMVPTTVAVSTCAVPVAGLASRSNSTNAPGVTPVIVNVGLVSDVRLSVLLTPVSLAASRSGAFGAPGWTCSS